MRARLDYLHVPAPVNGIRPDLTSDQHTRPHLALFPHPTDTQLEQVSPTFYQDPYDLFAGLLLGISGRRRMLAPLQPPPLASSPVAPSRPRSPRSTSSIPRRITAVRQAGAAGANSSSNRRFARAPAAEVG